MKRPDSVESRLGKRPRGALKLDDFVQADLHPLYTPLFGTSKLPRPPEHFSPLSNRLALAEIPSDFLALKDADFSLARAWRFFSRAVFETAFHAGYIVTDFIFDKSTDQPRSFYVLTHGESTLEPED